MFTITEDGNYTINGIQQGRELSLGLSGNFDTATVDAQYATAEPARATITLDDVDSDAAIVVTSKDAGTFGNDLYIALIDPNTPDASLQVVQDSLIFDIFLASDSGDNATVAIGTGANGTVTVTHGTAGTVGNLTDIIVVAGSGNDQPMTAVFSGANERPRIVVTLGTNSGGTADATKNTATLLRAAIDALDGFTASHSGTGADAVATQSVEAFTGGGNNPNPITTVQDILDLFSTDPLNRFFTAELADGADLEDLIVTISETALTGGTDGTFTDYATDPVSLTAAGEIILTNIGVLPTINLSVSGSGASTSIDVVATQIPI